MATITGLTKERLIELLNKNVVNGNVNDGILFLTLRDGTVVNAGQIIDTDAIERRMVEVEKMLPDPGDGTWRYVGTSGEPTFGSLVENFGSGYRTVRFRKDKGIVTLDGLFRYTGSGLIYSAILFVLPADFRPVNNMYLPFNWNARTGPAYADGGPITPHSHDNGSINGLLAINRNGTITVNSQNYILAGTHISISGLTFPLT